MQPALSLLVTVGSLGVTAMTLLAPPPVDYLYYAGLLLTSLYGFTFVKLRFVYAFCLGCIIIITYEVASLSLSDVTFPVLISNSFFLFSAAIIGLFANYSMELYDRKGFSQNRIIAMRTNELQQKNEELIDKNKELMQSREELLQSARTTELVFSALSEALPGTILDNKYQLHESIGAGGFGTVYRGTHLQLNRSVAIKVFRPVVGKDSANRLERFRAEGISSCRVHHENAVSVLDFSIAPSSIAYLVMELLEGRNLAAELQEKRKLTPSRSVEIAIPVCTVLTEVHSLGIIHRDIKPSNIFLHRAEGREVVKVVDFGIAKLMSQADDSTLNSLTATGSLVGTPLYMSPERLTNKRYDGRADVYSLGVMLYEMLCGCLPFRSRDQDMMTIAMMHLTHDPLPLRMIEPDIAESLETIVMKTLEKDAEKRPTAREVLHELLLYAGKAGERVELVEARPHVEQEGARTEDHDLALRETIPMNWQQK